MVALYEHTVQRAFQYLQLAHCPVDAQTAREVLRIVDAELVHGERALTSRVLDRLEARFNPAPLSMPPAAPPLQRGSVGHT